ncbi:hypothetical protein MTR67_025098 [Solanum verrucosum]|uniref:Uncharacterized protein n=1 Tax=Solanum verrucosum TaxID=315347 RepID=A0AAF0R056_SOLVR|nr:hypothetical protein MTR67_025098 [Solanum verrucosum]
MLLSSTTNTTGVALLYSGRPPPLDLEFWSFFCQFKFPMMSRRSATPYLYSIIENRLFSGPRSLVQRQRSQGKLLKYLSWSCLKLVSSRRELSLAFMLGDLFDSEKLLI